MNKEKQPLRERLSTNKYKIFRLIYKPIYKFLFSSFRHSSYFSAMQQALQYSPVEEMMEQAMEFSRINLRTGDYLEFGVKRGSSLASAYHCTRRKKMPMRFYAFDSFAGLPELEGIDTKGHYRKGMCACGLDEFKQSISKQGVDLDKITIVPGWYNETLNDELKKTLPLKKAAFIWIDCDLYKSTVPALDFITDYLQDGTIIVLRAWFCFQGNPNRGQRKAFTDWVEKNSLTVTQFHRFSWEGNSFIIHK